MTDTQTYVDFDLLSLCTVLNSFNLNFLLALSSHRERELMVLLESGLVLPTSDPDGFYMLRDDVQADIRLRLRTERPHDEITLHTRAFEHFLERMQRRASADQKSVDETRCLYHLSELRELLTEHREWHTIAKHVAAVRAAKPQRIRHHHLLSLYEGFVAIRTLDYDQGEAILMLLLDQVDLEDDIRTRVLHALGLSYLFQARYDHALARFQAMYTLACKTEDLVYQGGALINMSITYHETGYYEEALNIILPSLQIFDELRDDYRKARVLWHIGNNERELGRWQAAQGHFQEAINLYEMLGVQASLANLYWCQAFLHHLLGDEQKSESTYQRALTIAESSEHGDLKAAMDVTLYLGLLYQTQGRWDEAMTKYEQASLLAQRLGDKHLSALIHYRRGNLFKYQERINEAFAAYEQAITLIRTLRTTTESEEIKIGLLGTTQQVFEAMVLLCLEHDRPVDAFNYVERARSRAFLDTLIKKSPELYDALDQPVATLAEVQARLPTNAVLVEYFTTGVLPRGEHMINNIPSSNTPLREHLTQPARTIIFAITRDQFDVHVADLNPNALRPQLYDPGPGRRFLQGRLPAYLYERILQPVQHLITGRDQLFLVPHGPLHYVPFMALRSPNGDHLLAAGGPAIALAPSATILLRNCFNRPTKRADGFLALGYNDPRVGLQYAEGEARGVAQLMNGVAWTGPGPKLDDLLATGTHARWIHIAGHAVYNPHDPLASALQLGLTDALSARTIIDNLELKADLVTLSACTTGVSSVVPGDELLGLQRALLYAGVPSVVCTLWEAHDLAALLVMEQFYANLGLGRSPAAALRDAQVVVRDMTGRAVAATLERWRHHFPEEARTIDAILPVLAEQPDLQPFADPFYWAPFMLIGRP